MALELSLATPLQNPRIAALIDSAFQRAARESRLAQELARSYPGFDPGLSLLAREDGSDAGYALFLPRVMRIRGAWVRLAIPAPMAVLPDRRRRGVGCFLLRAGHAALRDRKLRGAIVLGTPEFFAASGYESAFNHYTMRVPVDALPPEGDTSAWVGLASRHLPALVEIQEESYAAIDGSERRFVAAIDWESFAPNAYTLVCETSGTVTAFVRFRVRSEIEISECGARHPAGVQSVLRFLRRLAREHRRTVIEVHAPPSHAVASELFQRGSIAEANNLGGAGLLCVVDWPGMFADTAAWWCKALAHRRHAAISFEIDGAVHSLSLRDGELRVGAEPDPKRHLVLPAGRACGLLTGQRSARELLFELGPAVSEALDPEGLELLHACFPGGTPAWTYSPVFEIADD